MGFSLANFGIFVVVAAVVIAVVFCANNCLEWRVEKNKHIKNKLSLRLCSQRIGMFYSQRSS